jgi:hypothetical protein
MDNIYVILHNNEIKSYCKNMNIAREVVQELADLLERDIKDTKKDVLVSKVTTNSNGLYQIDIYEKVLGYIIDGALELKHSVKYQACSPHH